MASGEEALQAAPTAGKRLLPFEDIMTILALKVEPCESDSAEVKEELADWVEFQEEVKREYMAKGYVEMEYFVRREKKEQELKEAWEKIDFGGLVFQDSDDDSYLMKPGEEDGPSWADGIVKD